MGLEVAIHTEILGSESGMIVLIFIVSSSGTAYMPP